MRLSANDPNSYSTPETVRMTYMNFDWTVNFERKIIIAEVDYRFVITAEDVKTILLDVRDIDIKFVGLLDDKSKTTHIPMNFTITDPVENQGSKLTLELPTVMIGEITIAIKYETSPSASALQWLTPEQTLGKKHPYLYSQCQAIHARSILPCQDTPAVKFQYEGVVHYPRELTALMSALRCESDSETGTTKFKQEVKIPSYLLALVVGKLESRSLGPISALWAEEGNIDAAAYEFSETKNMLATAEQICGKYVWKQYDLLVMPPSFPYGGMENPCLTFITPTLLAGDKSLANVVAHEIAHSWTGNLVTNKNFEHFWLNEGFTVFVECKIVGRLQGDLYRDFHSITNLSALRYCVFKELAKTPELTKLVVDLSDLNPDDAFSSIPYMKGSTFLRYLEDILGGPAMFEPFLQFYLHKYQFESIETKDFKETLFDYFLEKDKDVYGKILEGVDWDTWLHGEGMPIVIPEYKRDLVIAAENHAKLWIETKTADILASPVLKEPLSSEQIVAFLDGLLEAKDILELDQAKIDLLGATYKMGETKNAEIRVRYLRLAIKARLMSFMDQIITFANSNFRMKFVRPVYRELAQWPEAKPIAIANFEAVRNQMINVCAYTVAKDLGLEK